MKLNEKRRSDTINRLRRFVKQQMPKGWRIIGVLSDFTSSEGVYPHWFCLQVVLEDDWQKIFIATVHADFIRKKNRFHFCFLKGPRKITEMISAHSILSFSQGVNLMLSSWV